MTRILPDKSLDGVPCSIVAVTCALGDTPTDIPDLKDDGYATLASANKYIRSNLPIKKRVDYKRGQRPVLKDLDIEGRAIVLVLGHFIYFDGKAYHSFFNNDLDEVVSVWLIKD